MGFVVALKDLRGSTVFHRWFHKLFKCPTFWMLKPKFTCPGCDRSYRCYWDGNDIEGVGTDYCGRCARRLYIGD